MPDLTLKAVFELSLEKDRLEDPKLKNLLIKTCARLLNSKNLRIPRGTRLTIAADTSDKLLQWLSNDKTLYDDSYDRFLAAANEFLKSFIDFHCDKRGIVRKRAGDREIPLPDLIDHSGHRGLHDNSNPADAAIAEEMIERIWALIPSLPQGQKEVVDLFLRGLGLDEIATRLNKDLKTIKSLYTKAGKALKSLVERDTIPNLNDFRQSGELGRPSSNEARHAELGTRGRKNHPAALGFDGLAFDDRNKQIERLAKLVNFFHDFGQPVPPKSDRFVSGDPPKPPPSDTPPPEERPAFRDALLQTVPEDAPYVQQAKAFLSELPMDEELRLETANSRIDIFRREATRQLQAALNAYLDKMAQAQRPGGENRKLDDMMLYEKKQFIVQIVNSTLDRLGLAIGYKGLTCYMGTLGGTTKHGRFLLVPKGSKSPLLSRVNLSDFLPLILVDASPLRPGSAEWREREQARQNLTGCIA
jgi:hypothetical protein